MSGTLDTPCTFECFAIDDYVSVGDWKSEAIVNHLPGGTGEVDGWLVAT